MSRTLVALLALVGAIIGANLMIANVGSCVAPGGPCLIPVWPLPLIMAPSGVLLIGVALVARDALHEVGGARWVFGAIALGAALSAVLSPVLALASGVAFALGELADYAVYAPVRRYGRAWAVAASGVAGAFVDSALFLWLAFGSLDFLAGQMIGKLYATVAVALWLARPRQ
jgi:queuosine precursor transporter